MTLYEILISFTRGALVGLFCAAVLIAVGLSIYAISTAIHWIIGTL